MEIVVRLHVYHCQPYYSDTSGISGRDCPISDYWLVQWCK